jgi:hypothetical protein
MIFGDMKNIDGYLTIKVFAETVGKSVQAVHKAIKAKRVGKYMRVGYMYLIHKSEAKRFKSGR